MHYLSVISCVLAFAASGAVGWSGTVVFEDNFDGNSLDMNKWKHEEGCSDIYGARNLQCYTRRNVIVGGGVLKIVAKQERMEDKSYTSARISQIGQKFAYGAYVMRAKLAKGDGLWPAFWTLSYDGQCRYEEIDILEFRGNPSKSKVYEAAGHWGRNWAALTSKGVLVEKPTVDLSADFHEYAVLWLQDRLEWYFDNQKVFEVSLTDGTYTKDPNKLPCTGGNKPFDKPSGIILNLAVGGPFFDGLPPINPATWSQPSMEVDWVRIYQG